MDGAYEALSHVRDLAAGVFDGPRRHRNIHVMYSRVFDIIVRLGPAGMDWLVRRASELSPTSRAVLLEIYPLY